MGIVRPEGTDVNDIGFPGEVPGAEEQAPTVAAGWQFAQSVQATEMVSGVTGACRGVMQAEERLVLVGGHRLEVSEHLVAQLGTVHLGAEARELNPAPTPAGDEILASHVWAPEGRWKVEAAGVINVVCEADNPGNLVQFS